MIRSLTPRPGARAFQAVSGVRYTKGADRLRQANQAKYKKLDASTEQSRIRVAALRILQRASPEGVKLQHRRILEERTAQKAAQVYASFLVTNSIQSEVALHRENLSYIFFNKCIGNLDEEFSREQIQKIMKEPGVRKAIYDYYAEELSLRFISDPRDIGLDVSSPIEDLEASLQAANNFALLGYAFHRQFGNAFQGSPDKILYFFECLGNRGILATQTLDLTFQSLHPDDTAVVGLTWIPLALQNARFLNLRKLILRDHHLVELPRRFFSHSRELRLFDISENPLLDLPTDFAKTWKLKFLFCDSTHIDKIPLPALKNCSDLLIFGASNTPYLAKISTLLAQYWSSLRCLDLRDTKFSHVFFPFDHSVDILLNNDPTPPSLNPDWEEYREDPLLPPEVGLKVQDHLIQAAQS